ncbi:MAG: aspartyl protease family protein [Fulvivirga sp.]
MKRLLLCIFLIFSFKTAVFPQTLGFQINSDVKRVTIPFETYNNLIVVPVILNNQIPLKFIIDTGVRTAILTEKAFSDILGLEYSKRFLISGIGEESTVEAFITNNVSLTLPGIKGRGHAMLVLNEDYLELRNYLGTEVHGILGYELFSRFIVTINYDSKLLTLTTPEHFKPKRSYQSIPITVEDTKPYLNAKVSYEDGSFIPVKMLIDTGASHGILIEPDSHEGLYVPEKHVDSELGRGIGGKLEGKIARINYFHIGKYCWKQPIATFPTTNSFLDSLKYGNVYRNGSIGGEILSRMKVVLDFPGEKIYIKRGKSYNHDFDYNLSGLVVKAKGSRLHTYEIVDVRDKSVGKEAGFKPGDIILSINNIGSKNMTLGHVTNFLNAKENKRLKIEVDRDGEKLKKIIRLKSQI